MLHVVERGNRCYERALITGATSGIGAGFAEILPRETALLLTGRRIAPLRVATERLAHEGRVVEWVAADLATASGRAAVIERALARGIDLFVCNAGLGRAGPFIERPFAAQETTVAVNVLADLQLLHALLPAMVARARARARRCGAIIVSSTAAFNPRPDLACYAASKAFELHFGLALAAELREEPIDLLVLCPSRTATEFFARAGLPPPQRAMAPEQVAREAMAALGRRTLHLCGRRPQCVQRFLAFNPGLAALLRPWRSLRPKRGATRARLAAAPAGMAGKASR
jgi:uncharacterized protein